MVHHSPDSIAGDQKGDVRLSFWEIGGFIPHRFEPCSGKTNHFNTDTCRFNSMGLDKSTLIHSWHCDANRFLEVAHRHCLQCHALLDVIIIDLLND